MRRRALAPNLASLIGPGATVVDALDGWPSLIDLDLGEGETARLATHIAPISSMNRTGGDNLMVRPSELRFQNPGRSAQAGSEPSRPS